MVTKGSTLKRLFFLLLVISSFHAFAEAEFTSITSEDYGLQKVNASNDLIDVDYDIDYKRNTKATFCTRPVDMVDTIVVHHSETRNTDTPQKINEYHLVRGTASDPWYMVAYSFLIMAPYENETTPPAKAYVGRPIEIVGAHAGTNVFVPMSEHQKSLWAKKQIKCGTKTRQVYDPSLVKNGKIKANVTTIGMVVIGNYSPWSPSNPNGQFVMRNGKAVPEAREPTAELIDTYARLSCQLQKQYPKITKLSYHNNYHPTSCPGTLQFKRGMEAIQLKAREYGCEFETVWEN